MWAVYRQSQGKWTLWLSLFAWVGTCIHACHTLPVCSYDALLKDPAWETPPPHNTDSKLWAFGDWLLHRNVSVALVPRGDGVLWRVTQEWCNISIHDFLWDFTWKHIFMNWQLQLHPIKIILEPPFETWFYFFGKLDLKTFSVGSFSEVITYFKLS